MAEGKLVTESREVSNFDEIRLEHFGELTIEQTGQESLTVETDPETLSKIRVEVKDGRLELGLGRDWLERIVAGFLALGEKPINYHITVKKLKGISIAGRATVKAPSLDSGRLELNSSGLSKIEIGHLAADYLSLNISGRSEVEVAGQATAQKITISGSAQYEAAKLQSEEADVRISGHGNANLWVTKRLAVTISGVGNVEYSGEPTISQTISGVGTVKKV